MSKVARNADVDVLGELHACNWRNEANRQDQARRRGYQSQPGEFSPLIPESVDHHPKRTINPQGTAYREKSWNHVNRKTRIVGEMLVSGKPQRHKGAKMPLWCFLIRYYALHRERLFV